MLLALIFLFGLAASYPHGAPKEASEDALVEFLYDMEKAMHEMPYADEGDDDIKTDLGKKLKEEFDGVLDKIKDAVEKGKEVKVELLKKLKELQEKAKDIGLDFKEKAKEVLEKVKDKFKGVFKKLLEKILGWFDGDEYRYMEFDQSNPDTELDKTLKDAFERILEKVREAIEKGKTVKQEWLDKIRELKEKMDDLKINIGNKAKELLEKIKEKAREYFKKLLKKFGLLDDDDDEFSESYYQLGYLEFDEEEPEHIKVMREKLNEMIDKIKDAIEKGKAIKEEWLKKAKELKEKLKGLKVDIGEKAKELLKSLKEKFGEWMKKVLDKWGIKDEEFSVSLSDFDLIATLKGIVRKIDNGDSEEDIAQYIKQEIPESEFRRTLLDTLENADRITVKRICEMIINKFSRNSRALKDFFEKVKDFIKEAHKNALDKFKNFTEWIKESFKGKAENIKDMAREVIDHLKDVKEEVAREALEFFRPYKDDMGSLWGKLKEAVKEIIQH